MKDRYDFSKGVRGQFYKPDAVFRLPIYLDEKVQDYIAARADAKGVELADGVNDMLRKDIELIEVANSPTRQRPPTARGAAISGPSHCSSYPPQDGWARLSLHPTCWRRVQRRFSAAGRIPMYAHALRASLPRARARIALLGARRRVANGWTEPPLDGAADPSLRLVFLNATMA